MMRMVRELGITSVGEGIETGAQWRFLSEHGCELGQGHIVSPPVPAAEIPALVVS
jgi:EAL domain-containing protein (putative c-di-GMP-specific phosphodiesterase class I)